MAWRGPLHARNLPADANAPVTPGNVGISGRCSSEAAHSGGVLPPEPPKSRPRRRRGRRPLLGGLAGGPRCPSRRAAAGGRRPRRAGSRWRRRWRRRQRVAGGQARAAVSQGEGGMPRRSRGRPGCQLGQDHPQVGPRSGTSAPPPPSPASSRSATAAASSRGRGQQGPGQEGPGRVEVLGVAGPTARRGPPRRPPGPRPAAGGQPDPAPPQPALPLQVVVLAPGEQGVDHGNGLVPAAGPVAFGHPLELDGPPPAQGAEALGEQLPGGQGGEAARQITRGGGRPGQVEMPDRPARRAQLAEPGDGRLQVGQPARVAGLDPGRADRPQRVRLQLGQPERSRHGQDLAAHGQPLGVPAGHEQVHHRAPEDGRLGRRRRGPGDQGHGPVGVDLTVVAPPLQEGQLAQQHLGLGRGHRRARGQQGLAGRGELLGAGHLARQRARPRRSSS